MKPKYWCTKRCCKDFWFVILIILGGIILGPLALVFSGPYVCILGTYECLDNKGCLPSRYDCCARFWVIFFLVLIMGPIGFAADAVTIPGLIIYGIGAGIYFPVKWLRENCRCCCCCRRVPETAN